MKRLFALLLILALLGSGCLCAYADDSLPDLSGWTEVVQLEACRNVILGVREDGSVLRWGGEEYGLQQVDRWRNVRQVLLSQAYGSKEMSAFGLLDDGTVVSTSRADLSAWREIRSLVGGSGFWVAGLTGDGTVRITEKGDLAADLWYGSNGMDPTGWDNGWPQVSGWKNVVELVPLTGWTVQNGLAAVCRDGSVRIAYTGDLRYAESWTGIVSLCSLIDGVVGLKKDGTLAIPPYEMFDPSNLTRDPWDWKNMAKLRGGFQNDLYGITKDGKVDCCCCAMEYTFPDVVDLWSQVEEIYARYDLLIALQTQGTLLCSGPHDFSALKQWKNLQSLTLSSYLGENWILGLTKDGRVYFAAVE